MTELQNKKQYILIDVLKLLFAFIVMIHHINLQYGIYNQVAIVISYLIDIIVPFYFVCSGFFLYRKIINKPEEKNQIVSSYLKKIGFMYLIWTCMMFVFRIPEVISIGSNLKEQAIYWIKYLRIVLFIGEYQLWYLIGLIQAIIIFFFCYKKNTLKYCYFTAIVLWTIKWILAFGRADLGSASILAKIYSIYIIPFGTIRNGVFVGFIYLMIGCFFAKHEINIIRKIKTMSYLLTLCCSIIFWCFFIQQGMEILIDILTMIIVSLSLYLASQIRANKNKVFLRDLSTWVYVSHLFFLLLFQKIFGSINYYLECIICIGVVTGVYFVKNLYKKNKIFIKESKRI